MRTTLEIPEKLLKEAMGVSGAKTKSEAIRLALEQQINLAKRKRLLTFKGKIDLNISMDQLRSS